MIDPSAIEFDAAKDRRNQILRGISFYRAIHVLENPVRTIRDDRHAYGEIRYVCYGLLGRRLHVCIYTLRAGKYRIISLRKANRREVRDHHPHDA